MDVTLGGGNYVVVMLAMFDNNMHCHVAIPI